MAAYQPSALAAASGCDDDLVNSNLEESPYSLAKQLATLPGSTVLQPVKGTELLGRYAVHVQVRIPQTCPMPQLLPSGGDTARRARHHLRQAGREVATGGHGLLGDQAVEDE